MKNEIVSQKQSKFSLDEIAINQANSASDALFDEFTKGAKELFRGGLHLTERVHDGSAAFLSTFLGEKAAEAHTSELERDTIKAMKSGNLDAAEHYLDRNLRYTLWTQGTNDVDSRRVLMEYEMVAKANEHDHKEAEEKATLNSRGLVSINDNDDPAVQMAALIVNRYHLQKAGF